MHCEIVDIIDLLGLEATAFVRMSYHRLLGRWPEPDELAAQTSALRLGIGRQRLLADIAASAECTARQQRLLADGDDADCVRHLYQMFVDRSPDAAEMEHHIGQLQAGRSRERVGRDISHAPEARAAATFWSELSRLVAEEKTVSRGFVEWLGGGRHSRKSRNRELESVYRQAERLEKALAAAAGQTATLASDTTARDAALQKEIGQLRQHGEAVSAGVTALDAKLHNVSLTVDRIDRDTNDHHFDALAEAIDGNARDVKIWRDTVEASLERLEKRVEEQIAATEARQQPESTHPLADLDESDLPPLGRRTRSVLTRMKQGLRPSMHSGK